MDRQGRSSLEPNTKVKRGKSPSRFDMRRVYSLLLPSRRAPVGAPEEEGRLESVLKIMGVRFGG